MGVSVTELTNRKLVFDSECDTNANEGERDVVGGPATLHRISVKNSTAVPFFLLLFDNAAPTVDATEPDFLVRVEASGGLNEGYMSMSVNPPNGLPFATALSFAGSLDEKGEADPASAVEVTLEVE